MNKARAEGAERPDVVITTADWLPGYEIVEVLGEVFGLAVRSRHIGSQMAAGFKSIVGGELRGMTQQLGNSRTQGIDRMVEAAHGKGANAIVAMRFDNSSMGTWSEVCAYGTAVRVRRAVSD